jgi:hypothetical protein
MALRNSNDGVYFFESMQAGQLMVETMLKQALIPDPSFIRINCWESRFARIDCFP